MPYWGVMGSDAAGSGPAVAALAGSLDVELRPSLLTEYSDQTLAAYGRGWRRFQGWLASQGYQTDVTLLTADRLLEYVSAQVQEAALTPSTLQQTCNAVIYFAERAGIELPDARQAKEQVRRYQRARDADGVVPAWRVPGRRTPRRGRRRRGSRGDSGGE